MAFRLLVFACAALLALDAPRTTAGRRLVVIVHRHNPVEKLTLPELRKYFRAERKHWPDGEPVVLVMREAYASERTLFLTKVYQMDDTRYRRFWLEKIFRGEADRPLTAMSAESMRQLVSREKGAVGFLWEDEADASVKVILIDGTDPLTVVGPESARGSP
ncbi:MAG: hypothetical protein HYT87_19560 [Nitrospirae bacterium]|nr:hypothetical protein [Nitrospirota bacterium]